MADFGEQVSRKAAILDAAEALFAEHGYDAVTLRAIAARAGVDVALANYHFGRKHELFEKTFQRRADLLNAWRLDALRACQAKASPGQPGVRDIIDAYLRPLLTGPHLSDPGWRNYYGMVAYVNSSTVWGGQLMTRFFDPAIREFIKALRAALPDASDDAIYWGYHCLSGALTLAFAQTGRLDHLSGGKVCSTDLEGGYRQMVDFITAGFERIAVK
ncbi:TetR/AcrR family transcriptional regulator [Henriciella mobilis]|uniref:TetR/AcrR family transcriptional regulator n=1 Tax=Henriciella mobilis TaxID=2305467 RepID=UPI000E66C5D5|nr:TetR family transcriptional regulator [Henriciella mobilis]RIJ18214.1 TetR/AcrR family transcriptional regulator [Henriciella mobilis]RIJ24979.1 TetR/AcrR family transcriptional regulator [Henriciella mobilis]